MDLTVKAFITNKSESDWSSESEGKQNGLYIKAQTVSSGNYGGGSSSERSGETYSSNPSLKASNSEPVVEEDNIHRLLEQCSLFIDELMEQNDDSLQSSSEYSSYTESECSDVSEFSDCSDECIATDTESVEAEQFDYDNPSRHLYDAHLPLIQCIDFNPDHHSASESEASIDPENSEHSSEVMTNPTNGSSESSEAAQPAVAAATNCPTFVNQLSADSREKICIQCCVWPDVQKSKDNPVHYHRDCYHMPSSPFECAFGGPVNHLAFTLTDPSKDTDLVGKRQALESALKTVFFLLISQFEEFPWDIASLLYGVSVIDRHDLDVATSSFISASTRAEILAVTLVRHLRHFPDSFDDACKVLKHVSALQIANDKLNLPALEESLNLMDTIDEKCEDDILPNLFDEQRDLDVLSHSSSFDTDIIAEDAVSHGSRLSITSACLAESSQPLPQHKDACKAKKNLLLLHQSCLVNRSTRSLDDLLSSEEHDINSQDQNGRTPLLIACLCLPTETPNPRVTKKQREKIRCLVTSGAETTVQDYDGNTPLHISALRRDPEILNLLLHKSSNKKILVSTPNKNGRTALHYACYWGDLELILPLLERDREEKANLVNVQDRNGDTSLHIASRRGYKKAVEELLRANANKEIKNIEGKTAGDVARENKNYKLARKLGKSRSLWQFSHSHNKKVASEKVHGGGEIDSSCLSSSSQICDSPDGLSSQESDFEEDEEERRPIIMDGLYD